MLDAMTGGIRSGGRCLLGVMVCLLAASCQAPLARSDLRVGLRQAVERDLRQGEYALDFEASRGDFIRRHGAAALPVYEGVLESAEHARSVVEWEEVRAAIRGMAEVGGESARKKVEAVALDRQWPLDLSRYALRNLVENSPEKEKVRLLRRRLLEFDDADDRQRTIHHLLRLGHVAAMEPIREAQRSESRKDVLGSMEFALVLLADPSVCRLIQDGFIKDVGKWLCNYVCAGPKVNKIVEIQSECREVMPQAELDALLNADP